MSLEPNRAQIEIFLDALLRHRGEDGYLSLRAFYHDQKPLNSWLWRAQLNGNGFQYLIDHAVDMARRAANDPQPAVFCPPLAVFNAANGWQAREEDLLLGLALSVECDERPEEARQKLQDIVGGATVIVRSGGQWIDPGDGLPQDRLHLHWRLKVPAIGDTLPKLKRARMLATAIVGGDTSNVTAVHPIRWPGSWHRKGTPRLCESVSVNPDCEIDLDEALAALEAAAPDLPAEPHQPGKPQASDERIAAALAVIPNNEDWHGWNVIGMAVWCATAGSASGFLAFDTWSKKSPKYDPHNTAARWARYFKSPPTNVGAGTIIYRADQASPGWWQPPPPEPEPGDPGPTPPEPELPKPKPDELEDEWDAGDDPGPIPPRQWLLGNQFCCGFLSSVVAAGGTGKSALRLLQFISLAIGRELCSQHVFRRSRVLLISLEDGRDELQRHIQAVLKHFKIDRAELKGWLFCYTPRNTKLAELKDRQRVAGPLEKKVRAMIERRRPDLISFDPFIKTHGLAENDSGDMDFVCDLLAVLAHDYGTAVDSPHHVHKGLIKPGDADSGRGASGIRDAGRLVYTLTPMSEAEAKDFNIDSSERQSYVRLDSAKVNIAARDGRTTWFRLVGVLIDNATHEYPSGDTVQVAEPVDPTVKTGRSTFDQIAAEAEVDHLFMTLLRRFTEQGRNVSSNRSSTYAPSEFANEPEAKKAKVKKEALKEAMARLFAAKPPKILNVEFGPPSKLRTKIVEASNSPSNTPSNTSQHVPTGCVPQPPYTPAPVGRGSGQLEEAPSPPNGVEEAGAPRQALRQVLAEWRAAYGVDREVSIDELLAVDHPGLRAALLAVAAIPDSPSPTISNVALGRWLRDFADVHLDRLFLRYERVDGQGSQLWSLRASPSPAATGQEGEVRVDEPGLNRVLEAWRAAFGIDRTVSIDELVAVEHKDLKAALLAVAAMPDTDSGSSVPNHSISNILLKRWLREANGIRLGRLSLQRVVRRGSAGSQLWSLREGDAVPPDALAAWQRP